MEMVEDFETYSSLADVGELRLHCTGFTPSLRYLELLWF